MLVLLLWGVEPPITYDEAERYRADLVRRERAKGDPDGFAVVATEIDVPPAKAVPRPDVS